MSESTRMNPHEYSVAYHLNHVIGIMPTEMEAMAALNTLVEGGFLESEVTLTSGQEIADRIGASSGRWGTGQRPRDVSDAMAVAPQGIDDRGSRGRVFIGNNDALPVEGVRRWGNSR